MEANNSAHEDDNTQNFDALLDAQIKGPIQGVRDSTVESNKESMSALAAAERSAAGRDIIPSPDFAQTVKARQMTAGAATCVNRTHLNELAASPLQILPYPINTFRHVQPITDRLAKHLI